MEYPNRKFTEILQVYDYEVMTDTGWQIISAIAETIRYQIWYLKTTNHELLCADTHIVYKMNIDKIFQECFVKDLVVGDFIMTNENQYEKVEIIEETPEWDNMYDIQLSDKNHRYYTNDILSHNSLFLANISSNAVRAGSNVAYISLEMMDRKVVKRLGANLLGIPIKEYDSIAEDSLEIKRKLSQISCEDPFSVVGSLTVKEYPTSTASVPDLEIWLKKMEELKQKKFKLVVVDYLNIMRNWRNPNTENTYMKIKQIAEDLRAMGQRNDWTIASATQLNRSAFSNNDVELNQISESAGLIHTVDGLFGIIQDEIMYMNNEYWVKALALRDEGGKNSKKRFTVNYEYMRIIEDANSEIISGF